MTRLRTDHGWSQSELARRSGVIQGTISRLEAGAGVPNDATRMALAAALGVSVYDLFRYDAVAS